jgi:hypothetical protein
MPHRHSRHWGWVWQRADGSCAAGQPVGGSAWWGGRAGVRGGARLTSVPGAAGPATPRTGGVWAVRPTRRSGSVASSDGAQNELAPRRQALRCGGKHVLGSGGGSAGAVGADGAGVAVRWSVRWGGRAGPPTGGLRLQGAFGARSRRGGSRVGQGVAWAMA